MSPPRLPFCFVCLFSCAARSFRRLGPSEQRVGATAGQGPHTSAELTAPPSVGRLGRAPRGRHRGTKLGDRGGATRPVRRVRPLADK